MAAGHVSENAYLSVGQNDVTKNLPGYSGAN